MNFDVTTFIFEVINFLVLVWLLKRILYQPVLKVVNERQERIQKGMAQANQVNQAALQLKVEYENRLNEWQHERKSLRLVLDDELKEERERQLTIFRKQLDEERIKKQVIEDKALQEKMHEYELKALALGGEFAARLLTRLASPQLEQQLCALLLEDLENSEPHISDALKQILKDGQSPIRIQSAMPLSVEQRSLLSSGFQKLTGAKVMCEFTQNAQLIAGVAVDVGTLVLHANLGHELAFFSEANNGSHL